MLRRSLGLVVSALPFVVVDAWITTSQARFGLTIQHILNESQGLIMGNGNPQSSLGYLWSQPSTTDDAHGLGGGITWHWDERLCSELQFEEHFWGIPFGNCASIKASMYRAFDTWSMNSRHIKFTDVSDECAELGYTTTRCPLAEIWVTTIRTINGTHDPHGPGAPVISTQFPQFTTDFRYTNAEYNVVKVGNGADVSYVQRQVAEVVGGTLGFRTRGTCWYQDSAFCNNFHSWKSTWGSPTAAYVVGVTLFMAFWFSAFCFMTVATAIEIRFVLRKHVRISSDSDRDADFDFSASVPAPFLERLCTVVASFSIVGTALRLLLIVVIWPYYTAIFVTCWSCYDFEAGAAHEIGHLLGLGHPELAPQETLGGYMPEGTNSYHEGLAEGIPFDSLTCLAPWARVRAGVPQNEKREGDYAGPSVRPSIMLDFSLHNPRHCLEFDDLEAINVLYPDCLGGATTPVCAKPALNLGWLRMVFTLVAFAVALLFAAAIHHLAQRQLRKTARPNGEGHGFFMVS